MFVGFGVCCLKPCVVVVVEDRRARVVDDDLRFSNALSMFSTSILVQIDFLLLLWIELLLSFHSAVLSMYLMHKWQSWL